MENLFWIVIIILGCAVYAAVKFWKLYTNEINNKKFVAFVAGDNNMKFRNGLTLYSHIRNIAIDNNIDTKYFITSDEMANANLILNSFKQYITEKHFNDSLSLVEEKFAVKTDESLLKLLSVYLSINEDHFEFYGISFFDEIISSNYSDAYNWSRVYSISHFAIAYYKLMYISAAAFYNNPSLAGHAKEVLETNQIEIMSY